MSTSLPTVDWGAIEAEYRTGLYSLAELAARHGGVVTREAIHRRAKRHGWLQEIAPAIKRERERILLSREATEAQIEDATRAAAQTQADVISAHKEIAARLRRVIGKTVEELERDETLKPPVKAQTARHLSGALSTVADTERKAHGIDETSAEVESYEDRLRRIIEQAQ